MGVCGRCGLCFSELVGGGIYGCWMWYGVVICLARWV